MTSLKFLLTLPLLSTACAVVDDGDAEDGIDDSFLVGAADSVGGIAEGSPEAIGVLKAANISSFTELDVTAKMSSLAAQHIVDARVTKPFAKLAELDAVPYVGPTALKQLLAYARVKGYVVQPPPPPPPASSAFACTGVPAFPTTGALLFKAATKSVYVRDCDSFGTCTAWTKSGSDIAMTLEAYAPPEMWVDGTLWLRELSYDHYADFSGVSERVDLFSMNNTYSTPTGGYTTVSKTTGLAKGFMSPATRTKICNAYGCSDWSYHYSTTYNAVTMQQGASCLSVVDDDPATNYGHQVKNVIKLTW